MLLGFVIGLGVAYLLSFFHVDQTIIAGVKDWVKLDIGNSGYYLLMGVVGAISREMIGGFISGLIVAFLFTFVKIDAIIIQGLQEWLRYDLTISGYYLLFAVLGAVLSLLKVVRMCLSPFFFLAGMNKKRSR